MNVNTLRQDEFIIDTHVNYVHNDLIPNPTSVSDMVF